jgi:hypothetical protein
MATAIELAETRNESWNEGKISATRRFSIWDDSAPLQTAAAVRALFGTSVGGTLLPDVAAQFPDDPMLYCKSYSIKVEPSSNFVWTVEFSYENSEPLDKQPQEIGYTQFSVDWAVEFRDVYRIDPGLNIPEFGNAIGEGTDSNCAGTSIDSAGEPMSRLHYLGAIEFTETVSMASLPERSELIRVARGRRNLQPFQGAPIGQVLYKGAKASRIGVDRVSLTHSFAQDSLYHMVQVAERDQDGKPVTIRFYGSTLRAKNVYWLQPYPGYAEFNLLSENF